MEDVKAPPIGPALQRRRKERGLTLEQLAALSGVSKSMLSQIERGQANPTFAVLWSLTRALGIGFDDLVGAEAGPEPGAIDHVPAALTPEIGSPDGGCRLRILSPPALAGRIEWYDLAIAPGARLDSAAHAPGAQEHLTVQDGTLSVGSGAATLALGPGETARYPADRPHRIENTGATPARAWLVVLFGP